MKNQIFISYSKKDHDFAWKLADDLVKAGHKVWIDRSLQVGEDWEQTIEKQLAGADEVIVVLSGNAIASKWVQHEGSIAYGLRKRIYPVLIEEIPTEDLPIWMSKFQYHSFLNVDYESSFRGLNSVLLPQNPVQDLLEQKHFEFKTYQLLLEPKELEIIAVQIENQSLKLSDEDKRLLLCSAAAHGLGERWVALFGESSLLLLREAILEGGYPRAVRIGAAGCLGTAGDRAAYEGLSLAIQEANTGVSKEDLLDTLAVFLHHAPVNFGMPKRLRWDIFLRLARLRVRNGAPERWRMKRVSMAAALLGVAISYAWVVVTTADGVNGDDLLLFTIFAVMGTFSAFVFAEIMTSLGLILKGQRLVWRMVALLTAGSITGYLLFQFVTGEGKVWSLGSLIGLELAVLQSWRPPQPELARWVLSALAGILAALLVYLLLMPLLGGLGAVVSGAIFTAIYIFWTVRTR